MITIGFTGTRSGMSAKQKRHVTQILRKYSSEEHDVTTLHGGCIGADIDFHEMCENFKREVYLGHFKDRPEDKSHVGDFKGADIIHESQTHFKRNRDIVDRSDILIATPYNDIQRGGTWYTINYAQKNNKPVIIIER